MTGEAIPDLADVLEEVGGSPPDPDFVPSPTLIEHTEDGRRKDGRERKFKIKEIHKRHREMARLAAMGLSNLEISRQIGVTPQCVSDSINSPLLRSHINDLQASRDGSVAAQARRLSRLASQAIDNIEKGVSGETQLESKDLMRLSTDVLDRTGHGKTHKLEGKMSHGHMTVSDIEELKKRHAEEKAKTAGVTVDVQAETSEEIVDG